ncbi:MAG: hypothetical protein R3F19_27925 [Verrucomicrobiales bacterium]
MADERRFPLTASIWNRRVVQFHFLLGIVHPVEDDGGSGFVLEGHVPLLLSECGTGKYRGCTEQSWQDSSDE